MAIVKTGIKKVLTGNNSVSWGVKLSRVQVISAYPITPQTTIVELLSEMVANRELEAEFIKVESEHSAMSAVIGASAAGARAFTATSAQGLALMHEMLHWAAGARLPIVLANVNRAFGPPWSIWTEQTDSLAQRDTGWIQIYVESNQEALDNVILAYKVAEQVNLPVMIVLEAFVLSHTNEPVEIYPQEMVDEFLPPRENPLYIVEPGNNYAVGALGGPDVYMEWRYKMQKAMEKAIDVIKKEGENFGEHFGRKYGLFEEYIMDDADIVLVSAGAFTSTVKYAVRRYREETGEKVGVLKLRTFRPFPAEALREILCCRRKVAVLDRNISFGHHGIFYSELKSALYRVKDGERPLMFGYILGLGGRDITAEDIKEIIEDVKKRDEIQEDIIWKGVKS